MTVIVAGSRTITDPATVDAAIRQSGFQVTQLLSGTARGVDTIGEQWARARGVDVLRFPANWQRFGRAAGYRRNAQLAQHAAAAAEGGALVAVWDGVSRGTRHMIDLARQQGLAVYVHLVKHA